MRINLPFKGDKQSGETIHMETVVGPNIYMLIHSLTAYLHI